VSYLAELTIDGYGASADDVHPVGGEIGVNGNRHFIARQGYGHPWSIIRGPQAVFNLHCSISFSRLFHPSIAICLVTPGGPMASQLWHRTR
jgi:hypothetical protein